ncbi:MAG: hypothetical protein ACREL3_10935 [Gemmatimonadales bacterium]
MTSGPVTGPAGPFPRVPLSDVLERRWLHYAFVTTDEQQALIANLATLGGTEGGRPIRTSVLLAHNRDHGWTCSQWHASLSREPWTSYRNPPPPTTFPRPPDLEMRSLAGSPAVSLHLTSTSTPAPAGVSHFHRTNWKRWQAQPGVLATGRWDDGMVAPRETTAVGYHERVNGRWAWPEMGGWVFGFCNQLGDRLDGPPSWAVVFALLQPADEQREHTAMVMVWRGGRMVLFIPRRGLRVSIAGQLDRDRVVTTPFLAPLLGTAPTAPIPAVLSIDGYQGSDWIQLRFHCRDAARLVVPSETSFQPFSVHEVIGHMDVRVKMKGATHQFASPGIVEFAGGASERAWGALR